MGRREISSSRSHSWVSVLLPTLAALWGSEWGCGGIVEDSRHGVDAGPGSAARGNGPGPLMPGVPVVPDTCGNGVLEGNEQCDTVSFAPGLGSCAEATM